MIHKKFIAAALVALLPSSAFAQSLPISRFEHTAHVSILDGFDPSLYTLDQVAPCDASKLSGRQAAADEHGTVGWFIGGLGAGVGLGLIGTGIMLGITALSSPKAQTVKAGQEEGCYRDGYKSKAKNKNLMSALWGGLAGTAVWTGLYLANSDE